MDVDDAFARLILVVARLARRRRELAGFAARDRQDRVGDQARDQTALRVTANGKTTLACKVRVRY